jgi:pSer/pThr/pTyr-binding forkhead associated (FHA) protein
MEARLIVIEGKASRAEIHLKLPAVIGRRKDSGLVIMHKSVSRQHCELFEQDGRVACRDNHSSNGTFINEHRVTQRVLHPGDKLRVGPLLFRVEYVPARHASPLVSPQISDDEEPTPASGILGHGMGAHDDDDGGHFDALGGSGIEETALSEDDGFGFLGDEDEEDLGSHIPQSSEPVDEGSLFDPLNSSLDDDEPDLSAFSQFDHQAMARSPGADDPSEGPSGFGLFNDPVEGPDDSPITSQGAHEDWAGLAAEISEDDEEVASLGHHDEGEVNLEELPYEELDDASEEPLPQEEPSPELALEQPPTVLSEPKNEDASVSSPGYYGSDDLAKLGIVVEEFDYESDDAGGMELPGEDEAAPKMNSEDDEVQEFVFQPIDEAEDGEGDLPFRFGDSGDDSPVVDPAEFQFGDSDVDPELSLEDEDDETSGNLADRRSPGE